jgi:membrane protease YdiL (CAAX protease family)
MRLAVLLCVLGWLCGSEALRFWPTAVRSTRPQLPRAARFAIRAAEGADANDDSLDVFADLVGDGGTDGATDGAPPAQPPQPTEDAPGASAIEAAAPLEAETPPLSARTAERVGGPTPFLHRAIPQILLCIAGYLVHVCVLSRRSVSLGGVVLGWDTAAGLAVLAAAAANRARNQRPAVPPWLYGRASEEASDCLDFSSAPPKERLRLLTTVALFLGLPIAFSYFLSPLVEVLVSLLVIVGLPLNKTRVMSMRLILEQALLNLGLFQMVRARHPGFFTRKWVRWSLRGPWLAPVLGGYTASLALFNLVEPLNQALLPGQAYLPEGVVAQLANPSDRSLGSLLLASIAPCIGAPLFEELQSRAFILQALTSAMPIGGALLLSGFLFGAQHMQIGLVLPLSVTGFFWAVLYVNSRNLLVPILIHALWNARIFLGSYLGL